MAARSSIVRIAVAIVTFCAVTALLLLLSYRDLRPASDYDEIELGRTTLTELTVRYREPLYVGNLGKPIPELLRMKLTMREGVDLDTVIVMHFWFDETRTRYFEVLLAEDGVVISKSSLYQAPRKRWLIEEFWE
jgi:hypothetical protein